MNTITKCVVLVILCLVVGKMNAQDTIQKSKNQFKIESLDELKKKIEEEEREYLKKEVEAINLRLENGEITQEKADALKKEVAKKRALNIENRIAIIDNKIELLKRNEIGYDNLDDDKGDYFGFSFGGDGESFAGFRIKNRKKFRKYDKRTTSDLVFAAGFNNAIGDGQKIGDEYGFMNSGFVELGWAWKTRVFKNSNALRLKYGFSFQWNKLSPKDDRYFVQDGNVTTLEEFPYELKESEFRVTNLVVPVYFEFGPSKKIEKDDYFRYSTHNKFKIGVGAYAGFNIGTQQKLRYKQDGDRVKEKIKRNYNTSDFVYGLGAYVGYGSMGLYMKYDLNPLFKDQAFDQHNLSMGLRFDLD
ncbi:MULTISPECIES: hypothetical protein [Meridianimaribacter]|mgnify:CR=1 FL=1|uniref:PorT family protein n=1 Tax=Meridianimaribacter flavus TaxID=571115 RepID=A0ABY2G2E6_9FLAO|nr:MULTISPECIES: hypothetical protein [Meridianimaribacter]TBV24984.1 hypothetical protein DMZ43_14010 [Meridianimaribacter sp. CL38]TDY10153.1 hypothetical protein A8975_2565 [Meridianimaribacter flavus]